MRTPRQLFCLAQRKKWPFTSEVFSHVPYYVTIGKNVHIATNVTFSPQGFGFEKIDGKWLLIPHVGSILIGDDVSIYEGTIIVNATARDGTTEIGEGTKIDTNCHIAHNVKIGKNCLIISGSIIGGSTVIGDNCYLGIGCKIKNKVKIGNNVTIGMGAVVLKDVPDGVTVVGNPAKILLKK